MLKKNSRFLCLALALLMLMGTAVAENAEQTPMERYANRVHQLSDEAFELNIGVTQADLASNSALEMAFLHQYPNAKIVYRYFAGDQLSAYLLSGEKKLDLLILTDSTKKEYAEKGILEDLYAAGLSTAWPENLIDIKAQAETDGKLYGFPKRISQYSYLWFNALGEAVGAQKPRGVWTWDDFLAMCRTLPYDANGDGQNEFHLMYGSWNMLYNLSGFNSDMVMQYICLADRDGKNMNTPEFERVMGYFMDTYSSGAITSGGVSAFQGMNAVLISQGASEGAAVNTENEFSFILPPTLDAAMPTYPATFYTFSLMYNAPHKEAAVQFLKNGFDADVLDMTARVDEHFGKERARFAVENSIGSPYELFIPDEQGVMIYSVSDPAQFTVYALDEPEEASWSEDYAAYIFMMEHFIPTNKTAYIISKLWFEQMTSYMAGTMSFSDMADVLDARLSMIRNE